MGIDDSRVAAGVVGGPDGLVGCIEKELAAAANCMRIRDERHARVMEDAEPGSR